MEKLVYEGENQPKIEKYLLGIYTIYSFYMIVKTVKMEWSNWVGIILTVILAVCWMMNLAQWKTYKFRAVFSAVMMQIILLIYFTQLDTITIMLPVFAAFIVFFGLYGIEDIILTTYIFVILLFLYAGIIAHNIPFGTWEDRINVLAQIVNMFLLEYIVYSWTKRNGEGSRQLLGMIDELKAVENRKDDFLANVSHEIRTPINTICGMSEIISKEDFPEHVKENVQGIQLAGKNLMAVVSDILDFSELQSGNIQLEEETYNIASTIHDIINMTMARKNEKKLELIVDCDATIPCALIGDEKKIRRVILNLLDNAIKFTEQGCVSITVGYRKESYGINLIVKIKDTGIGIDAESLEKLFIGFNQVDGSRKRQEGGLGLGLAISHALAQKLGATLTMKSKVGKGTTVKFVIPQKVLDETPIATINDRENVKVATYIDMEQFDFVEIRDEYSKTIVHMVEQLRGNCHICRNFAELQRRQEKEKFTHIFISIVEYRDAIEYFDKLSKETKVIVVLERSDEKYIKNPHILKIYKPFYILAIVSVLNNDVDVQLGDMTMKIEKFTTRNAHVLVVDDNRMNLRVMEGLLAHYNIKTTTADSGEEALRKIGDSHYDFVFMDHMMPQMDGVETLHCIRQKPGTYFQKVPIVALTANAVAGMREMMLAEGFDDFLEKPVERSVLERVLQRNLPADKIIYKKEIETTSDLEEQFREEELASHGLDVKKGLMYCDGKTHYMEILREYCETYEEAGNSANQKFEQKDWKNYTIIVHGMKSSLRTIGAMEISKMAADLEQAGKNGQIDYILDYHNVFLDAYQGFFKKLCEIQWLMPAQKEKYSGHADPQAGLPVLDSKDFERLIVDLEDAAYALDGGQLQKLIAELQNYQYSGLSLRELLEPAQKKVEKTDYFSAVELIKRMKNNLTGKEE